jgi:hypothetical protein
VFKLRSHLTFVLLFTTLIVISCREDIFVEPEESGYANLFIDSQPRGANIFVNGEFTELKTPAWLNRVSTGKVKIKLKLDGYIDTTFAVHLKDSTNELINIFLKSE